MANDTREDHGSYYPGAKVIVSGSGTSGTATDVSGKVDRVTIGEIGDTYTNKDIKEKINSLIRALAPVASCLAAMLCMSTAMAATEVFEDIPSNARVVVSEDDPVALAAIPEVVGAATNAAVEAAKTYTDAAVAIEASNRADAVEGVLIRSKSYTDRATNALAAKIPVIDLDPYAAKSWVEAKGYITSDALGGVATKEWIRDQGYLTQLAMAPYATMDWVLGKGYATESDINGLATKSELDALKRRYADTNGVTRLWSEDGLTMTDGTGVVWSVSWAAVTNWVSLTNGIVYRPTAPGVWIGDGIITNREGAVGVGKIEYVPPMPGQLEFGLDGGGGFSYAEAKGLFLDYSDEVVMRPDAFTGIVERAALYVPMARVVTNAVGYVANGTSSAGVDTNAVNDLIASATKGLATAADVESKADKATTLAGYGITDAMPLVEDVNGKKTAVTIGRRSGTVGPYSLANGNNVTASGQGSHADGLETVASGLYSHANGMFTEAFGPGSYAGGYMAKTLPSHRHAFVWNGIGYSTEKYLSNDEGTFNINPIGGPDGFYIGEQTLSDVIFVSITNNISAENPTFSNAVLAVGLNIDTDSVAVLNDIAETFGGIPIEGTATTVGGLLAALAAAVAWLRKNKVGSFASVGGASATVENGVAKLDDFFTESNSVLTATIDARLPYPINAVPSTGLLKDRAINTTNLASVTVPDNFTDLLIRASVASSLSVTMPEAITTKYGDTFPGEAGEYLITITKTGASEAYVRTIKLEVANA